MRNILLAVCLVLALAMAVPAMACAASDFTEPGWYIPTGESTAEWYQKSPNSSFSAGYFGLVNPTPPGGTSATGGTSFASTGNATATGGEGGDGYGFGFGVGGTVNNNNTNKIEKGAVQTTNTNKQKQDQTQKQRQLQDQEQDMNNGQTIAPTQTITIKTEKPYMPAPSPSAPDLTFGSGKMDWDFANALLRFGVPTYKGENIASIIDATANVKAKNLIATVLSMKKAEMPITYNTRILIVKKEAQKSYAVSIIGAPAASGALGTTGVAGSAVVGPSFAGTKANDLFDIYLVKVE
jgi:hypothetical protein